MVSGNNEEKGGLRTSRFGVCSFGRLCDMCVVKGEVVGGDELRASEGEIAVTFREYSSVYKN